jgi:hypothetical protein
MRWLAVVDALGAVLDGDLARREVGDELRNHERRGPLQPLSKSPVFLDRRQSAEADSTATPTRPHWRRRSSAQEAIAMSAAAIVY